MVRKSCSYHGVNPTAPALCTDGATKSSRDAIAEFMDKYCNCNERMNIERRILYYPEFDIFRLATWSYQGLQWDEHPGVMNNPISVYSKLKNTNESFNQGFDAGRRVTEINYDPRQLWEKSKEVFGVDESKVREVFGVDEDKVRFGIDVAKENLDAVAAVRNGEIIGHVVQGPNGSWDIISKDAIVFLREELDAKTDGTEPQRQRMAGIRS